MEECLISVVVPIYNVEKYIEKCIDSIINQTYTNTEIILVDDGSTDNSGKIAEIYKMQDKRVKVIHKRNGGLSDARNVGMKFAKGKYICFIDSDDYVEKTMLNDVLKYDKLNKDVLIWGFYTEQVDNKEIIINKYKNVEKRIEVNNNSDIEKLNITENLLKVLGYAWNKLYKLEFLKANKLEFEYGLSGIEDTEFNSRVLQKTRSIMILDEAYNHYMQRPRITLGTQKYDLELYMRLSECHTILLKNWNIDCEIIEKIKTNDYITIMKIFVKSIIKEKYSSVSIKLKKMLSKQEFIEFFKVKRKYNFKDKIFCFLIRNKAILILKLYYKILKNIYTDFMESKS